MDEGCKWWDDGNKWRRWWRGCTRLDSERDLDYEPQVQVRCRHKGGNPSVGSRVQVPGAELPVARRRALRAEHGVPSASARCKCQMPIAKGQELSGECQVPSARASRRMLNADDAKAAPRDAAAEK